MGYDFFFLNFLVKEMEGDEKCLRAEVSTISSRCDLPITWNIHTMTKQYCSLLRKRSDSTTSTSHNENLI